MKEILKIEEYKDIIGGEVDKKYTIKSGERVEFILPPGCWGPMITPELRSGHEVSYPIYVEDAEIGDSICITVEKIKIISPYTTSGISKMKNDFFIDDPTSHAICPYCNIEFPKTEIKEIGKEGIICKNCKKSIIPQFIENGYTMVFDENRQYGFTVYNSKKIAEESMNTNMLPKNSIQNISSVLNKDDVKGVLTRVNPFIGNIGCSPKKEIPSSRNCGDSIKTLKKEDRYNFMIKNDLTDAHMDIPTVGENTSVISPVLISGAGVYLGDVHAMQGNGELAGHTTDIIAEVIVKIDLIKNLLIDGPIIIPRENLINDQFRKFDKNELEFANSTFSKYTDTEIEQFIPLQFIGSGNDLEEAIYDAVKRASSCLKYSENEIKNRATISGSVDIGRVSGLVYITVQVPYYKIKELNIL